MGQITNWVMSSNLRNHFIESKCKIKLLRTGEKYVRIKFIRNKKAFEEKLILHCGPEDIEDLRLIVLEYDLFQKQLEYE